MATSYTVLAGCNYPPDDTRAEAGDVIELPRAVGESLLALGAVELLATTRRREAELHAQAVTAREAEAAATAERLAAETAEAELLASQEGTR